jgi:uncharacterized protein (DUF885 family)
MSDIASREPTAEIGKTAAGNAVILAGSDLAQFAKRYWDFRCEEFPMHAILAGVTPHSELLTRDAPADHERRAAWAAQALAELDRIPSGPLSLTETATLLLLRGELTAMVDLVAHRVHLRPGIYLLGPESQLSDWASMTTLATAEEARRYIARVARVKDSLEDARLCLEEGCKQGFRYPRHVVERTIKYVRDQASVPVTDNPFLGPLKVLAARGGTFGTLLAEGEAVIVDTVLPAFAAYSAFMEDGLLPATRDTLACIDDLEGEQHYRFLIRQYTTTDMSPDEIHEIGLAEVARLSRGMELLAAEAGLEGDLDGFRRQIRSDNAQILESAEALREAIEILAKRIDARIPEFFGRIPRMTYGVKSIPEGIAAAVPPAYAQPNPADNSGAGIYWVTSMPAKLPRYMHVPMTLHEGWPGHLMHLALIQELTDLPEFRRHGAMNYSACLEGWALYCEALGEDMGLYDSPDKRYGRLEVEMWRAARLVVDTGLHGKGWSRAQAIDYFGKYVAMPIEFIGSEVDRYIGVPGQALGYQIGNLKFRELRARAERELGDGFDLRAFNDALSSVGAVSLTVLDTAIGAWIETRQRALV